MKQSEKKELHKLTHQLLKNAQGARWLDLMGERFHENGSTALEVWPLGRIDVNATMKKEGQRSVVVGIRNLLKKPLNFNEEKDDER